MVSVLLLSIFVTTKTTTLRQALFKVSLVLASCTHARLAPPFMSPSTFLPTTSNKFDSFRVTRRRIQELVAQGVTPETLLCGPLEHHRLRSVRSKNGRTNLQEEAQLTAALMPLVQQAQARAQTPAPTSVHSPSSSPAPTPVVEFRGTPTNIVIGIDDIGKPIIWDLLYSPQECEEFLAWHDDLLARAAASPEMQYILALEKRGMKLDDMDYDTTYQGVPNAVDANAIYYQAADDECPPGCRCTMFCDNTTRP